MKWLFWVLVALLLIVRLPSLAQPAGGDQGIYSYIGQAIARGEVPYRDAWDQKPPGIHLTYALMFGLWRNEAVVAGADLGVAALVAWLLVLVGRPFSRQGWEGHLAAVLFLGLGNPAFLRLSGMWVRAQCETFIGLAVTAGVLALLRAGSVPVVDPRGRTSNAQLWSAAGGFLLGIAFVYKYNTLVYTALAAVMVVVTPSQGLWRSTGESIGQRARLVLVPAAVGFVVPVSLVLLWLARAGALNDFYQATIVYNLDYSGETYASAFAVLRYLLTFPVRQSAVDPLWLLGGLGTAALLVAAVRTPALVIVPAWVAATCLSITVNGSRGLPQYFVQAAPALALAAGIAAGIGWGALGRWRLAGGSLAAVLLILAVARVGTFDKLVDNTLFDVRYLRGGMSQQAYLARFGGQRQTDKFSALASRELGAYLGARTAPTDRVFVFGFSPGAYTGADRRSASRFFWSRPILVGFNEGMPRYGAAGLLADLQAARPKYVVLQQRDWPAEGIDSTTYFLGNRLLSGWLRSQYRQEAEDGTYLIWVRP